MIVKKIGLWLLVLLCCVPLLFINMRHSHDWGGDFSLYIQQAINLVDGVPQQSTYYVYNPEYPTLSPKLYPIGFPMLLAPVYWLFGNNITAFIFYLSLLYCVFAVLVFAFFREEFSYTGALLLMLLVIYHPWALQFKAEVMAEIPFSLFFMAALLAYQKNKSNLLVAAFVAVSILIKPLGYALLLGLLADALFLYFKNKEQKKINLSKALVLLFASLIPVFAINILFKIPSSYNLYREAIENGGFANLFLENIANYLQVIHYYFNLDLVQFAAWRFAPLLLSWLLLAFIFIGLLTTSYRYLLPTLLAYTAILLLYPYQHAGFRYLFTLFSPLLLYAVWGFKSIPWRIKVNNITKKVIVALVFFMLYLPQNYAIIQQQSKTLAGPQEKASQEVFAFIKTNTKTTDTLAFSKPRVLGLYCKRMSFCPNPNQNADEVRASLMHNNVRFAITNSELPNLGLEQYLLTYGHEAELIFSNKTFKMYRLTFDF